MAFDLTKFDQPSDADEFIELALVGLSTISSLLGARVAGPIAGVLTAVQTILKAIQSAYDGKLSFEEAHAEFQKLLTDLGVNDAAADAALREKFDTSDAGDGDTE